MHIKSEAKLHTLLLVGCKTKDQRIQFIDRTKATPKRLNRIGWGIIKRENQTEGIEDKSTRLC